MKSFLQLCLLVVISTSFASPVLNTASRRYTRKLTRRNHFDSTGFCQDYIVGEDYTKDLSNYKGLTQTVSDELTVMKCLVALELIALPHNVVQDFRWVFTDISRQSHPWAIFSKLMRLPFALLQTVTTPPYSAFKEFSSRAYGLVKAQHDLYVNYI